MNDCGLALNTEFFYVLYGLLLKNVLHFYNKKNLKHKI